MHGVHSKEKSYIEAQKSGLSARVNNRFGQRRQPLVPMLCWIIVLGLQQRCKELQNDASSQLEAIDAVWYKLKELCSQMPNKRLPTLASRPILNPSFAVCNQSTLMTRTIVHSLCMFDFFIFSEKNQNVCVRTTRNIDIKNDGLVHAAANSCRFRGTLWVTTVQNVSSLPKKVNFVSVANPANWNAVYALNTDCIG